MCPFDIPMLLMMPYVGNPPNPSGAVAGTVDWFV